ncbi:helix-turn-helix domain-containing protein [Archangium sp.]|uniref:helix-turn-helix domain-containing protein n=1 Tax=Archangium sp. TaxID=1872627 RepID=UPI002D717E64|nr:helix-turn-helix domain-containing protein [Archangium sp.]HYO59660.1 helix-turn-helix domain-containing protein [Archangium sp.]
MFAMKHFEQQSYYELLEVPVSASEEQILDAYARAMETYSPDSIAVYTLAEPEQLEALRQRLTQAMEVLCALEQRIAYDRELGVTRSPEEVARMRAESLKRAAEATAGKAPANGEGEPPVEPKPPVAQEPRAAQPQPEVQSWSAAEEEPLEGEPLEAEVVTEEEPVAEAKPFGQELASGELASEAQPEVPSNAAAPSEPGPGPAAVPVPPMAAKPAAVSRSLTPAPLGGLKPAIHARPVAPVARHGSAVPPPLPSRNGAIRPFVRTEAESQRHAEAEAPRPVSPPSARSLNGPKLGEAPVLAEASAIATAESALAQVASKARDSRTRLKTVVDIPSDAEFSGELLRQVREGRNLSLQMLADRTRISSRHVENIEADRYDSLPAAVYLRGMLMSIARELGLDPLRVSRSYMGLVASGEKKHR